MKKISFILMFQRSAQRTRHVSTQCSEDAMCFNTVLRGRDVFRHLIKIFFFIKNIFSNSQISIHKSQVTKQICWVLASEKFRVEIAQHVLIQNIIHGQKH